MNIIIIVNITMRSNVMDIVKVKMVGLWDKMLNSCYNPDYKNYSSNGGKGIKVCDDWLIFDNFYNDMIGQYFENCLLKRRHYELGYDRENCLMVKNPINNRSKRKKNININPDMLEGRDVELYKKLKKVYDRMMRSCYDNSYTNYQFIGGRGIRMCQEWKDDFNNFYDDMYQGYYNGCRIKRIDPDGDYSKENCEWIENNFKNKSKSNYLGISDSSS